MAFRISLIFALSLAATTYVVFAFVYLEYYRTNVPLTRQVLKDEVRGTQGTPRDRLDVRLRLRLIRDIRQIDYVGLFESAGKLVLGHLSPGIKVAADGKAHTIRLRQPGLDLVPSTEVIAVAMRRADGYVLVLARNLAQSMS